uniref:AlNc14C283G10137 protein n=1 Tax=Albugo laibachii Nc14 TaxID=890382 RepID=F0WUZ0_9STRA|nr:AlNc14C283G10137 [Albugo laibachii Nc14]|eukprot:CCA25226.1 AlNc14C283G10137 [Albugo laibachii Nc14]
MQHLWCILTTRSTIMSSTYLPTAKSEGIPKFTSAMQSSTRPQQCTRSISRKGTKTGCEKDSIVYHSNGMDLSISLIQHDFVDINCA